MSPVRADGVEITQLDRSQAMRVAEVNQLSLHPELGRPVKIDRTLGCSSAIKIFSGTP
jgi:hypothetical protein